MVNNQKYINLKKLYISNEKPQTVKYDGSTFKSKNRSYLTIEEQNLKIDKNTVANFLNIPKKYFYLGSHGFIDRTKPKNKLNMIRTPNNVSIVFVSPVGMSISESLDMKSKLFYSSDESIGEFHKDHDKFLKNKNISNGLKKCIIIPPNGLYLDHTITFKPRSDLSTWEKKEFGLFRVPYTRRTKIDLLTQYKMYKKNINISLNAGDEKEVMLSKIVNTFLKGNTKGGIIFVDTCRIIWTQIRGMADLNRVCRTSGKMHCKTSKKYCSKTNNNGRSISIYPSERMSTINMKIRKRLSLDQLLKYKKFEENRSNLFKKLLIKNTINNNVENYSIHVNGLDNIKTNHKLNYTNHNNEDNYVNHIRSLNRQGIQLDIDQNILLKRQMMKTVKKTPIKSLSIKLKGKKKQINRKLYTINELTTI